MDQALILKMRISILVSLLFFISSHLFGQKTIKNGVIDFAVTIAKTDGDSEYLPDSLFVPTNLTYTHYFSSNSFLLENMVQDSVIRIRHHRSKNGQGSYFFNLENENYKIDELSEAAYKGEKTTDRLDVKVISGFNCYKEKYTISDNDYIELYVTKNVKPGFNYYQQIFPSLKGFPLEIIIHRGNQVYKYTAKSVKSLPDKYPLLPDIQQYKLVKEGSLKAKLLALIRA